jgi:hypothetical protein
MMILMALRLRKVWRRRLERSSPIKKQKIAGQLATFSRCCNPISSAIIVLAPVVRAQWRFIGYAGLSRNFGALVAAGAGYREKDVWSALVEVLTEHSSISKTEIRRETVLRQSQVREA